jgi:hypothetical protein
MKPTPSVGSTDGEMGQANERSLLFNHAMMERCGACSLKEVSARLSYFGSDVVICILELQLLSHIAVDLTMYADNVRLFCTYGDTCSLSSGSGMKHSTNHNALGVTDW